MCVGRGLATPCSTLLHLAYYLASLYLAFATLFMVLGRGLDLSTAGCHVPTFLPCVALQQPCSGLHQWWSNLALDYINGGPTLLWTTSMVVQPWYDVGLA